MGVLIKRFVRQSVEGKPRRRSYWTWITSGKASHLIRLHNAKIQCRLRSVMYNCIGKTAKLDVHEYGKCDLEVSGQQCPCIDFVYRNVNENVRLLKDLRIWRFV